jgi:hypothetical protein
MITNFADGSTDDVFMITDLYALVASHENKPINSIIDELKAHSGSTRRKDPREA